MNFRVSRPLFAALGFAGALCIEQQALAASVTLTAFDRGAINSPATVSGGQPVKVINGSHQVRHIGDGTVNTSATRAYLSFNLQSITTPITAATLRITHPSNSYDSPDASETVAVYDVTTSAATLQTLPSGDPGGTIFDDLGSGPEYAQFSATLSDNSTVETITLNAAALAKLNSVRGTATGWSAGLEIITATATGLGATERVLRGTSSTTAASELQLTVASATPVLGSAGKGGLVVLLGAIGMLVLRPLRRRPLQRAA